MDFLISAMLGFDLVARLDLVVTNFSDCLSLVFLLVFLSVLLCFPVVISLIIKKKINLAERAKGDTAEEELFELEREEESFDRSWGVVYDGISDSDNLKLQFNYIYIVRRILFIMIVFYLGDFLFF